MTDNIEFGHASRRLPDSGEVHFRKDPDDEQSLWTVSSIDWSWPMMTPNGLFLYTARLFPEKVDWLDRKFGSIEEAEAFVLKEIQTRNLSPQPPSAQP